MFEVLPGAYAEPIFPFSFWASCVPLERRSACHQNPDKAPHEYDSAILAQIHGHVERWAWFIVTPRYSASSQSSFRVCDCTGAVEEFDTARTESEDLGVTEH